ncbi:MAG: nucleotidyltransferase family protein [Candidatus Aminicenantales bacterium]|jgi:hypothetical protein
MEKREAGRLLCDFLSGRKMAETRLEELSPADGERLVDWALRFKVGGLFYREIISRNVPTALFPDVARNRLKRAYRNLATINTNLFFEGLKVLKSLAADQLPVIALKGLSLAKNIYGDIALRPMSDLDLLVKEKDLVRAGRILLTLGYKPYFPVWESMSKTYHHHLPPFTNKNGVMIELHWNIVTPDGPIKVDLDGLWERARFIKLDAVEVLSLSPEDLFLHLCIHACFHLQTGFDLIPLCDLAGLMKTPGDGIDWPVVMDRAARWGGRKCVYLMLLLVRDLLGAAPPERILSEMKPADYQPDFFDGALEQIFEGSPSDQVMRLRVGLLLKIKKSKGIRGKILVLLKAAFPSPEYLARFYSVPVSFPKIYSYYFFHLGGLMVHYTIVLLRLFRRNQSAVKAVRQERRRSAVSDWMFSS